MPVNQREYDLMQLRAQIRIMQMVEKWRQQFLGGRVSDVPAQEEPMMSTAAMEEEHDAIY